LLSLPAAKDLLERLAQLYGVGKARAMRRVDYESGAFKVLGYAALPSITEASRSRRTLSVNGRWVRAESLTRDRRRLPGDRGCRALPAGSAVR
jgi:DNA mismatch repair protein MutL